jgi:hypothetical protein
MNYSKNNQPTSIGTNGYKSDFSFWSLSFIWQDNPGPVVCTKFYSWICSFYTIDKLRLLWLLKETKILAGFTSSIN